MNLGEFVKDERLNRGMTQSEFAHEVGVSYVTINTIENKSDCGINVLKKLSAYLDVSIPELRQMQKYENNK